MLAVAYCMFLDPEIMVCDLRTCRVLRFCVNGDKCINPLNAKLNPICHLLALLGAHLILHVSRIRVNVYEVLIQQNSQGKGNVWTNPKVSPP
jgi:hypothetical protein